MLGRAADNALSVGVNGSMTEPAAPSSPSGAGDVEGFHPEAHSWIFVPEARADSPTTGATSWGCPTASASSTPKEEGPGLHEDPAVGPGSSATLEAAEPPPSSPAIPFPPMLLADEAESEMTIVQAPDSETMRPATPVGDDPLAGSKSLLEPNASSAPPSPAAPSSSPGGSPPTVPPSELSGPGWAAAEEAANVAGPEDTTPVQPGEVGSGVADSDGVCSLGTDRATASGSGASTSGEAGYSSGGESGGEELTANASDEDEGGSETVVEGDGSSVEHALPDGAAASSVASLATDASYPSPRPRLAPAPLSDSLLLEGEAVAALAVSELLAGELIGAHWPLHEWWPLHHSPQPASTHPSPVTVPVRIEPLPPSRLSSGAERARKAPHDGRHKDASGGVEVPPGVIVTWGRPFALLTVLLASHAAAFLLGLALGKPKGSVSHEQYTLRRFGSSAGPYGAYSRLCAH